MSKFQTSSTTPALFSDFFPHYIQTFVSDRSQNFALINADAPFDEHQHEFFKTQLNIDSDQIQNIRQVHGDQIVKAVRGRSSFEEADAIITNDVQCPIVIRTADCLPVFLLDAEQHAIGLIHAGWRGTYKKIVGKTILRMTAEFGSRAENLVVALGPRISQPHYQVGEEFIEYFPEDIVTIDGSFHFDLGQANKRQLIESGVRSDRIFDCDICTFTDTNYFSYRREALRAGRILSLMMIKE